MSKLTELEESRLNSRLESRHLRVVKHATSKVKELFSNQPDNIQELLIIAYILGYSDLKEINVV